MTKLGKSRGPATLAQISIFAVNKVKEGSNLIGLISFLVRCQVLSDRTDS